MDLNLFVFFFWQSRKILRWFRLVRGGTRINNPRACRIRFLPLFCGQHQ